MLPQAAKGWLFEEPTGNNVGAAGLQVRDLSSGDTANADVMLVPSQQLLTSGDIDALRAFLAAGGGVVVIGTGADAKDASGQTLTYETLPINALLAPFGLGVLPGGAPQIARTKWLSDKPEFAGFNASRATSSLPWHGATQADFVDDAVKAHMNGTAATDTIAKMGERSTCNGSCNLSACQRAAASTMLLHRAHNPHNSTKLQTHRADVQSARHSCCFLPTIMPTTPTRHMHDAL